LVQAFLKKWWVESDFKFFSDFQKLCVIGKLKKRAIQIIYLYTISLMIVLHNKGVSKERCGPGPSRGRKIISESSQSW
jgi:hypothetical protein